MTKTNITIALVKQYLEYKEKRQGAKERMDSSKANGNDLAYMNNSSDVRNYRRQMGAVRQSARLLEISDKMWDRELFKRLYG